LLDDDTQNVDTTGKMELTAPVGRILEFATNADPRWDEDSAVFVSRTYEPAADDTSRMEFTSAGGRFFEKTARMDDTSRMDFTTAAGRIFEQSVGGEDTTAMELTSTSVAQEVTAPVRGVGFDESSLRFTPRPSMAADFAATPSLTFDISAPINRKSETAHLSAKIFASRMTPKESRAAPEPKPTPRSAGVDRTGKFAKLMAEASAEPSKPTVAAIVAAATESRRTKSTNFERLMEEARRESVAFVEVPTGADADKKSYIRNMRKSKGRRNKGGGGVPTQSWVR
jgi:hypothetical protein